MYQSKTKELKWNIYQGRSWDETISYKIWFYRPMEINQQKTEG